MKHFDNIINTLIEAHKDSRTQYSSTQMFGSPHELSFAISRLMDAQQIFTDEFLDNKEMTSEMWTTWINMRDTVPSDTAKDLALCIIRNTPLSSTQEQINEVQDTFEKIMQEYTNNAQLTKAFTEIFFGEAPSKMPKMRDR
ncbi:hypothetical protein JHD50_09160 [Sulfurimonas sp. MAG313]|nr:hypothetical protein [Sulfurimonas sp. MAG313]MDF1881466.1 hypothetical protein [Sulfurimonas sp. MAG313]